MRGSDSQNGSFFSYVNLEERVPARHPLRKIKTVVDAALVDLDTEFAALYAIDGRPGIAPERLLRAALVQILFSIRSETQLMEQMQYNLLFRWFVGLSIDEAVWVPTVFTKNRDRLLNADIARKLMTAILAHEKVAPLLSDDHFSVDGTLVEAWASFKSFKPKATAGGAEPPDGDPPPPAAGNASGTSTTEIAAKTDTADGSSKMTTADTTATDEIGRVMAVPCEIGRNVERDWRGQTWSNATHASVTDPDARIYRKAKGKPAQLCYMGHALTENRNGFVVEATLTHADGTAERRAAIDMLDALDPGRSAASRSAPTRATTRPSSSKSCARCASRRTSQRKRKAPPSTAAPRGMRATQSARENASSSRSRSAGARRSGRSGRPCCADWAMSAPSLQ